VGAGTLNLQGQTVDLKIDAIIPANSGQLLLSGQIPIIKIGGGGSGGRLIASDNRKLTTIKNTKVTIKAA
jgi:hypothetical protein